MQRLLKTLFGPKSNAPEAACILAKELKLQVTSFTLAKEVDEHPYHASLLSISDVLNNYGIDNLSLRLSPEKLINVPVPFIASINGEEQGISLFTVVRNIRESIISFHDPEKHIWRSLPLDQFQKRYAGTVLAVETEDIKPVIEKDYDKKLKTEKQKRLLEQMVIASIPAMVIITDITAFFQAGATALLPILFSLLTLAGVAIGTLLVLYELDRYNPVLQQICSGGKKINCNAILQSKASKIGGISWSAIGLAYFTGQLFLLLISGLTNLKALFFLGWLGIFTLPYTAFSVYYQWRIVKQWCVLCLAVQALLVLQFSIAIFSGWHGLLPPAALGFQWLLTAILAFAVSFIAINVLVVLLKKTKQGHRDKIELQRLKHNPEIFEALLSKQKVATEPLDGLGIVLGSPDAKFKVIKVCNPYCGPCSRAHPILEALLHQNSNLQVQIIFTATNAEGDFKAPPVKHLLAIAEEKDETVTKKALDDWYLSERLSYEEFASKHPLVQKNGISPLDAQSEAIDAMSQWCNKMDIRATPTFFVSLSSPIGVRYHQLPDLYTVSDLKYFLTE